MTMDLDLDEQDGAAAAAAGTPTRDNDSDAASEWSDVDTDDVRSRTSAELHVVRPNRWTGNPSAWLHMTAPDRLVASSLDKVRNRDLAVHLYNAHALKTRKRRGLWEEEEQNGEGGKRWKPRALWTAWPQRLARMRPVPADRPSRGLADQLTATALRLAKERFHRRPDFQGAAWDVRQRAEMAQRQKKNPGRQSARDARAGRPTMTSDDDRSAALLRPAVRHVLAQLDRTLTMLHDVRVVGLAAGGRAESSDGETTEGDPAASETDTPRRRSRAAKRRLPVAAGITDNQAEYLAQWGLRDWSDVLGAAALAGFDGAVVARTAQRCADLFGQSMMLDTMREGSGRPSATVVRTVYAPRSDGQRYRVVDGDGDVDEESAAEEDRPSTRGSPELGERPKTAGTEATEATEATEQAETKGTGEKPEKPEKEKSKTETPPKKVYVPARKTGVQFLCPFAGCSRADDGFDRRFNLVRHLRLVHSAEASTDKADAL